MTGQSLVRTDAVINLPAVLIIGAVAWSHLSGVKESARFNLATVWIKLSAVFLFIGFGLAHANPALWTPFIPPQVTDAAGQSHFGLGGILTGASLIFFAYIGFDAVSTAAEETVNPQRNLPIAILGTLGISTLLYILVAMAMTGLADFRTLGSDAPIATALAAVPELAWLKTYVGVAVTIGLWAALWPCVFAVSRLLMVFSDDGFLPAPVAATMPAGIPKTALLTAGGLGMLVAGFLPIALLGELISTGTLLAFATVCAAVIRLRITQPDRPRPFRVPLWPVIATLGIASALFLLASMGWYAAARIAAWQAIGVGILLIVSQRRRVAA
jgi:APA family basic amino acid/polyamine antiporter